MVVEKKEEDIVGRLEALRKKVPPPSEGPAEKPAGPSTGAPDNRRRLARIVGILVIVVVLGAVFLVGSKMFLKKPVETPLPGETLSPSTGDGGAAEQARIAELAKAKSGRIEEVNTAFLGLSSEYASGKDKLIQQVKASTTKPDVEAVDYETPATNAWRSYRKAEVDKKASTTGETVAYIGNVLVKGVESIKEKIETASISDLKGM